MDGPDGWPLGVPAFDRLQMGQKLAALFCVGSSLLEHEASPPKLTQPIEATVATLFEHLRTEVHVEIDHEIKGEWESWRQLILDQFDPEQGWDELPEPDCDDHSE